MGMSGKTFLSAFQMGSRIYPDIVKARSDKVDTEMKRKVLNLQKMKMERDRDIAEALKERDVIGMKNLNTLTVGIEALDVNDSQFPSKYSKLVSNNITGISMSKRALDAYTSIDGTVKGGALYKSQVDAQNKAWVAVDWYNSKNPLNQIGPDAPPDVLAVVNDAYKKNLEEEKREALKADVVSTASAKAGIKEEETFKAYLDESGSSAFNPEDYAKPEAKNAMRFHNQLNLIKEHIREVGVDGMPILATLKPNADGSGYENLLEVEAKLVTLSNEQALKKTAEGRSMSEAESNSFIFSERMRRDNQVMDRMVLSGVAPGQDILNNLLASATEKKTFSFFNAVIDPKFQVWKNSADNFIRATLRRESGAAIADHEYIGGFKDYIELFGDSPELATHKRTLRHGITNAMRTASRVPWAESSFEDLPLQFQSKEQAERYKGTWLMEGGKGEYWDKSRALWVPFTVGKTKEKAANPPKPKAPNPNIRKVPQRRPK